MENEDDFSEIEQSVRRASNRMLNSLASTSNEARQILSELVKDECEKVKSAFKSETSRMRESFTHDLDSIKKELSERAERLSREAKEVDERFEFGRQSVKWLIAVYASMILAVAGLVLAYGTFKHLEGTSVETEKEIKSEQEKTSSASPAVTDAMDQAQPEPTCADFLIDVRQVYFFSLTPEQDLAKKYEKFSFDRYANGCGVPVSQCQDLRTMVLQATKKSNVRSRLVLRKLSRQNDPHFVECESQIFGHGAERNSILQ